ncbi:MAG: glycogen debranching protein [Ignavibacteriaceae bacterium]|nr:glycogen debranching protein [Ignavibacteriaceae bacterium]
MFIAAAVIYPQKQPIYQNSSYSIYPESVVQGEYSAQVKSEGSIVSNYLPAFSGGLDRNLIFKFSINGFDNERPPGLDHRVLLNPNQGGFVTPVYTFGRSTEADTVLEDGPEYPIAPNEKFQVVFRVNMNEVLASLQTEGSFTCYNGQVITKKDFKGVYIMGSATPLNWDFPGLTKEKQFLLTDPDKDGIYEISLEFVNHFRRAPAEDGGFIWKQSLDLKGLPEYQSPYPLLNALYKMSLEEMRENLRDDGAFMAGEKWTGVWTRDISYSILLSLAIVHPDACRTSLMAKVKDGIIIQDTGTGGSWPVSTDRMTWALAAYEVYLSTRDKKWLRTAFDIIRKSVKADQKNIFDPATGLVRGETSFLDWREQTYPRWMQPADIYSSPALGTGAVHARTYQILALMADKLNEDGDFYRMQHSELMHHLNQQFWNEREGYYNSFLYGRIFSVRASRTEALGNALMVLFNLSDGKDEQIIKNYPVSEFGTPVVWPQEPGIPPYHNNGIWPFVEAFRMWSAKKVYNEAAVMHSFASLVRSSALFLTNKENLVAETGSSAGTEINSDRQLWSVAGSLAWVYRMLLGVEMNEQGVLFQPYIPGGLKGKHELKNLKLGNALFYISVEGEGSAIASYKVNGKTKEKRIFNHSEKGTYKIEIVLRKEESTADMSLKSVSFAPMMPVPRFDRRNISWDEVPGAELYNIYRNGELLTWVHVPNYTPDEDDFVSEYQISAENSDGLESFLSEPLRTGTAEFHFSLPSLHGSEEEYITLLPDENQFITFTIRLPEEGTFSIDFLYANGSGPVNTDNKCAVRTLQINGGTGSTVVFPQRGTGDWESYGYSNVLSANLMEGINTFRLSYDPLDRNMDGQINTARVMLMRISRIYGS